ncbi:MFS transporter [Aeribacillus pallidus]|uniref:MFS transporter n=1 Tax=Aeribacillus pallidus TaxID=33936 RepID=A0A165X4T0_9BACI|nr:MFS transporter [Aeribacillus pallidus]KZN95633.1 MFS transporter [Aeribacillus pallidus]
MKRIHYSWVILIISFFSILAAGIVVSSSGVFLSPFEKEFGWDRSIISLSFGICMLFYGIAGPFMAALLEKWKLKKMILASMGILLAGLFLTFFMKQSWQLIIIWGIILGLGSSLFLTVLSPYVANHWFKEKRGLATGILAASTATGQLLLLPILAMIIENYSWRSAIGFIIAILMVMTLIIFFFMKNSPKEMGILPYGQLEEMEETKNTHHGNPVVVAFEGLAEAVKKKEFWLLVGSFFICGSSTIGLIGTHFVSYCIGFGIPLVTAASLLSFMGIFNILGTTISGWLSDRFDNRWLLFFYYLLRGISLVVLPFLLMNGHMAWLIVFTVFYGLDWLATVPPTINISRQIFGVQKSAVIYGWVYAAHQAGAAFAAYGGGLVYKYFNTYTWAFFMAGIFCVLASLFVIVIKKQQH